MKAMCNEMIAKSQVSLMDGKPNIFITKYHLGDRKMSDGSIKAGFKTKINRVSSFSGGMHKYLEFLPDYKLDSLNSAQYRVIIEFHRTKGGNDYLAYSTIEVKK